MAEIRLLYLGPVSHTTAQTLVPIPLGLAPSTDTRSDYYEKSDAERKLVFKLDCFMLASLTIGWWLKNIDQSNVSAAW